MAEENPGKNRLPNIPDSMLKISVGSLKLGNLKRKRTDSGKVAEGQSAQATETQLDGSVSNTGHNTEPVNVPPVHNGQHGDKTVHETSDSRADWKFQPETQADGDTRHPPRKRLKTQGVGNVLLYLKTKSVRRALAIHAAAKRKKHLLSTFHVEQSNTLPYDTQGQNDIQSGPNATDSSLDSLPPANNSANEESSDVPHNSNNDLLTDNNNLDDNHNMSVADEVLPPNNEPIEGAKPSIDAENEDNASVHSISSEDVAIDWQPDTSETALDCVDLETCSNSSKSPKPKLNLGTIRGNIAPKNPNDAESDPAGTMSNFGPSDDVAMEKNNYVASGNPMNITTLDKTQAENLDSSYHAEAQVNNETQDTNVQSSSEIGNGGVDGNTEYKDSNMDYQAVLDDIEFIYEMEDGQKVSGGTLGDLVAGVNTLIPGVAQEANDTLESALPKIVNVVGSADDLALPETVNVGDIPISTCENTAISDEPTENSLPKIVAVSSAVEAVEENDLLRTTELEHLSQVNEEAVAELSNIVSTMEQEQETFSERQENEEPIRTPTGSNVDTYAHASQDNQNVNDACENRTAEPMSIEPISSDVVSSESIAPNPVSDNQENESSKSVDDTAMVDAQKPAVNNTSLQLDMDTETADVLEDDNCSVVLEDPMPDEAESIISLSDSVDDDLLVDEQVTLAFHGRNESHDLFFCHALVGAMFRENIPNLRWEDDDMDKIIAAVKPLVKLMKASRSQKRKGSTDTNLSADVRPTKNFLMTKKGCEVYIQCSVGMFHLEVGPAIKGSTRVEEAFDQAIKQLKSQLNSMYLLTVGNFTELIWMNHRAGDRFDTYELCKYSVPLAAQLLTSETIYKFIIEESKSSVFRLQPITVTRVEEVYKDVDCKVVLSNGSVTGPVCLSRLLSGPALYRTPVVLIPVKNIPQPRAPETLTAEINTEEGNHGNGTELSSNGNAEEVKAQDEESKEGGATVETNTVENSTAGSQASSKDHKAEENTADENGALKSDCPITKSASLNEGESMTEEGQTAEETELKPDAIDDGAMGNDMDSAERRMDPTAKDSTSVEDSAEPMADAASSGEAAMNNTTDKNCERELSTALNEQDAIGIKNAAENLPDDDHNNTEASNNDSTSSKTELLYGSIQNACSGTGEEVTNSNPNVTDAQHTGATAETRSKVAGEETSVDIKSCDNGPGEESSLNDEVKGSEADTESDVNKNDDSKEEEMNINESPEDKGTNEGDTLDKGEKEDETKDDVSDDGTVSYHSDDLIVNEQTGDLQLREDDAEEDVTADLPMEGLENFADADNKGDEQDTQDFGVILAGSIRTLDPASAADFFFNAEDSSEKAMEDASAVVIESDEENDDDDLIIVDSNVAKPKEKSTDEAPNKKACSLVRCMLTTFYSHSPLQVGYGRKGMQAQKPADVSIDLTSDDEDGGGGNTNQENDSGAGDDTTSSTRVKSAMERFLDETSNVTLLKLRVFGGNQELVVNRRSTIAGLPNIFCMSLMGQVQTWFMGQTTTGLKADVTSLESLKSSLQTFFMRDNFSEVLVYVNKKHCYCVSAVSNGRFSLMNPESMMSPEEEEDPAAAPKGNIVMFFSSLSSLCFYLYQVISDIPMDMRRMLQLRGLHVTLMKDITKGHPVFRRLNYGMTAPIANFSLAGCLAILVHHAKLGPLNHWTNAPETALQYNDVIYAMMVGMSKNVQQAMKAISSIVHLCMDGTGFFIGLLNRMAWNIGNGPRDLLNKLQQNTLPCLLTMGGYHMVVDWNKQRNSYTILYPRSMKMPDNSDAYVHYMMVQHTNDLYNFLCTPFCISPTGTIQSIRINHCYHGNKSMLHMSAIEGVRNSAQDVHKVKPCFAWMGKRFNVDVISGHEISSNDGVIAVAEETRFNQAQFNQMQSQMQMQPQAQAQLRPDQLIQMPAPGHMPTRDQKLASMVSSSFEVCLASLLHYNKFRTLDFVQEYSKHTDNELTRHINAFKRIFADKQLDQKLKTRRLTGLVAWIDGMYMRVGFRLPNHGTGHVTRAQILSAGHSPVKPPPVLRALMQSAYPCLLSVEALTTTGGIIQTHILLIRASKPGGVFHVLYPQSFISRQPSTTVLPVVEMTYSTVGRLCVAIFQRIPATAVTVNYWLYSLDVAYGTRFCMKCKAAGPSHYHMEPDPVSPGGQVERQKPNQNQRRNVNSVQLQQQTHIQRQQHQQQLLQRQQLEAEKELQRHQMHWQLQQQQQRQQQRQQHFVHRQPSPRRPRPSPPQPMGRVVGQAVVTPPVRNITPKNTPPRNQSNTPNTNRSTLVNANKRPISLDNVSDTVTSLVTHLLEKSGLATREGNGQGNHGNTGNQGDADSDDDLCITGMEPGRASAQRNKVQSQQNVQRTAPQTFRPQRPVNSPAQRMRTQQIVQPNMVPRSPQRFTGNTRQQFQQQPQQHFQPRIPNVAPHRGPRPIQPKNTGVYPVALIPAANISNMNRGLVRGANPLMANSHTPQNMTFAPPASTTVYSVGSINNQHPQQGAQPTNHMSQPPPLTPAPRMGGTNYSGQNPSGGGDYINITPVEITPDANMEDQNNYQNSIYNQPDGNMYPDGNYGNGPNQQTFQMSDDMTQQNTNQGPIEIIPQDFDVT